MVAHCRCDKAGTARVRWKAVEILSTNDQSVAFALPLLLKLQQCFLWEQLPLEYQVLKLKDATVANIVKDTLLRSFSQDLGSVANQNAGFALVH